MLKKLLLYATPTTIRHKHKDFVQRAKAMQAWVDLLVHEIGLRAASEHSIFDTNPEDVMEMKLSDIYPSLERTQGQVTQLAERRTGTRRKDRRSNSGTCPGS